MRKIPLLLSLVCAFISGYILVEQLYIEYKAAYHGNGCETADLNAQNNDFFGILSIDGLINEPVVQGDNNSFYLSHSFTKEPERKGCLFADYRYRYGNNNLVIYGHNNYDGRGFSILSKYKDSLFAESHNEIVFIREDGTVNRYRVFLVVNYDTEDVSVCDPFLQDLPESFLVRIRKYPVYYYDDSIADLMERMIPTLILSTCDTEAFGQSGRLLVAGAQISSSANRKNDCKPFI